MGLGMAVVKHGFIALLAFTYSMWAIWGAGEEIIAKGFMLLTAGVPIYVLVKWMQRRDTENEAVSPIAPEPERPTAEARALTVVGDDYETTGRKRCTRS
jgi:APA family basic amino acid/polyamine antiporter